MKRNPHHNSTLHLWATALALTVAMGGVAAVQTGPTDDELAAAVAADLSDAQNKARAEFRAQVRAAMASQSQQQP